MIVGNETGEGKCSEKKAESTSAENVKNGGGDQQPPQKKKRLSNREYKKLMKGQNKVSSL